MIIMMLYDYYDFVLYFIKNYRIKEFVVSLFAWNSFELAA